MPNQQITWEDAQQMPDDGMRYEAIGGELIVTPAPNLRHQDVVLELAVQLRSILVEPGHGRLWISPVGVEFPATSEGVQPSTQSSAFARLSPFDFGFETDSLEPEPSDREVPEPVAFCFPSPEDAPSPEDPDSAAFFLSAAFFSSARL